jgi:hypothetical protein
MEKTMRSDEEIENMRECAEQGKDNDDYRYWSAVCDALDWIIGRDTL